MRKLINPWLGKEGYNCFGCAPHNTNGVHMEFYEDAEEIVSYWKPQIFFQGWVDTLHGGIQAVLLDEICAWTIIRKLQLAGVTSKMETRYLSPVSTNVPYITVKGKIREKRHNIVIVDAALLDENGKEMTTAICTYFTFPPDKDTSGMVFHTCEAEEKEYIKEDIICNL